MALIYCNGFSKFSTVSNAQRQVDLNSEAWTNGAGLAEFTHPLSGTAIQNVGSTAYTFASFYTTATTIIAGVRFYFPTSISDASTDILLFNGSYTSGAARAIVRQCTLNIRSTGDIEFVRGTFSDIARTQGLGLRGDRWYYLEAKILMATTATGTYEIRIDGKNVLSGSGVQTADSTTNCSRVGTEWSSLGDGALADFYVCDNSGSNNNDFLGDVHIETVFPDGDGNRNNWTPLSGLTNYEMVDERSPDRDTSYVSTSTAGDDELYTFAALTVSAGTVKAAVVKAHLFSLDGGFREVRALCRSSTSEATGASYSVANKQYRYLQGIFEQNPNGPAAWTDTTINAAEFGVELIS